MFPNEFLQVKTVIQIVRGVGTAVKAENLGGMLQRRTKKFMKHWILNKVIPSCNNWCFGLIEFYLQ